MAKKYTKEFKEEAVKLALEEDANVTEIAQNLGVSKYSIYEWRRDYLREREESGKPIESTSPEKELKRLRKENQRLKQERDILKKAMAIFSQPPQNTNS